MHATNAMEHTIKQAVCTPTSVHVAVAKNGYSFSILCYSVRTSCLNDLSGNLYPIRYYAPVSFKDCFDLSVDRMQ